MKKIAYLFFASFIILIASSIGFAQGNQGGNRAATEEFEQRQREMRDLEHREQSLRDVERERYKKRIDLERLRQTILNNALKELNEAGDALLIAVKVPGKKGSKDSAKLAERIAKLSKGFRRELNKNSPKAEPGPVPNSGDRPAQLFQLAEAIDKTIDQVIDPLTEAVNSVNVGSDGNSRLEQTCKQLAAIESSALSLRQLARRKD